MLNALYGVYDVEPLGYMRDARVAGSLFLLFFTFEARCIETWCCIALLYIVLLILLLFMRLFTSFLLGRCCSHVLWYVRIPLPLLLVLWMLAPSLPKGNYT